MKLLRSALGKESLVGELHRTASGKHGVAEHKHLVVDRRRSDILNMDIEVVVVVVLAVCAHESILCIVEKVEHTLMERQASTEDGSHHKLIAWHSRLGNAKRSGDILCLVAQLAAYLVGNDFTDTLHVGAETDAVVLDVHIAYFSDELV